MLMLAIEVAATALKIAFVLAALGAVTSTVLDIIEFDADRSIRGGLRVLGGTLATVGAALGSFAIEWDENELSTWWPIPVILIWALLLFAYASRHSRHKPI